jgi:integrase
MSVYKRGRRWWMRKRISGKQIRKSLPTARTKAEAESAERAELLALHNKKYGFTEAAKTILKEFVENTYLPYSRESKRSYKDDVGRSKALIEHFGKKALSDITPFEIEAYKIKRRNTPIISQHKDESKRTQKPRSLAVINREICLLSAIYTLAIEKKKVADNPCLEVNLYPEQGRIRYLSSEEEERLMSVLTGEREHLRDLAILAIHTGMRESELFKLTPGKLDFIRGVIHVTETKTDEDRQVPMNETARALLLKLGNEAKAKCWRHLFTNPKTGSHYTTIKTAWKTACRLAGITNLRFHDLRHTFGTRAADAAVPLTAIAKVMGHASTQTTERYAHATDEGMRRAVEALEKSEHNMSTEEGRAQKLKIVNR